MYIFTGFYFSDTDMGIYLNGFGNETQDEAFTAAQNLTNLMPVDLADLFMTH